MARIKIVFGSLELEYEGEQDFIETRLVRLAEEMLALGPAIPIFQPESSINSSTVEKSQDLSTNTIAQIISAKTGTDLALAAIARINLVKKNPTAARPEILDEMREAVTYFKESYASNLTSYLDTLVRSKRVNLVSRSNYALAAAERSRFEAALTNGG